MLFRHLLRDCREAAGLDQGALGERLGVSQSLVSRWEKGQRTPQPEHFDSLAAFLGMGHDELVLLIYGKEPTPDLSRRLDAVEAELRDLADLVRQRHR